MASKENPEIFNKINKDKTDSTKLSEKKKKKKKKKKKESYKSLLKGIMSGNKRSAKEEKKIHIQKISSALGGGIPSKIDRI